MKGIKFITVVVCLIAAVSGSATGQVRVVAQVDTSKEIYVGQEFVYVIIIDGDNKPAQVDLTPLAKYSPQSAGNRDVSQTSISIMNNRTTKQVVKRFVMSYSLTANQPGQIQLPSVTATLDGKQYQTNPVQVNILVPGKTDKLDFDVVLSEQKCYVGQPVILTVKFYVSVNADVGDFQFDIPALTSGSFDIEDPEVSDPQAKLFRLHTGMNAHVSQHQVVHNGENFILVSFSKVLLPRHPGQIDLGANSVSAALAVGRVRSRDSFFESFSFFSSQKQYKRFAVNSRPLELTVLPLPEEGKPAGFYGLVGRYTIEASATPTKVNIGDPITLVIKVGGSSYLKSVRWPELELVPELAQNFKIPSQRASPAIQGGFKVFTQTIRANNDKIIRIPSIPLPLFDADEGKYIVAETEPIKLEVAPTRVLTNVDLQGVDSSPVNKQIEAIKKGLSANYEGPDVLMNQTFSPLGAIINPGYAVVWSVPLAGLIISAFIKFFTHTSPEKLAQKRRRQARSKAHKQLKTITALEPQQRQELLVSTMKQYIGERFDKVAGSLTAEDCYQLITSATPNKQIAERYRDIITGCEASRYTSTEVNIDSTQIDEVAGLIRSLEKNSKK